MTFNFYNFLLLPPLLTMNPLAPTFDDEPTNFKNKQILSKI